MNVYMCMNKYAYVCMCVCVYVCKYVRTHTNTYTHRTKFLDKDPMPDSIHQYFELSLRQRALILWWLCESLLEGEEEERFINVGNLDWDANAGIQNVFSLFIICSHCSILSIGNVSPVLPTLTSR
jgi:hypothetical protein